MHFSFSTLMAPYLHQFSAVVQKMQFEIEINSNYIWCKFGIMIKLMPVVLPSNDAILDEFSEQHQHHSIKKSTIFNVLHLFVANKVQI